MATNKTPNKLDEEHLSQEEIAAINELLTSKNESIQVSPSLENYFNQLQKEILAYKNLLHDEISARLVYQSALKPKMDPYIVGGLTSGLVGGAAGLYAASETASKNQNIDEKRAECRQKVSSVSYEVSRKAREVRQLYNTLKEKISTLPQSNRTKVEKAVKTNKLQHEIEELERIFAVLSKKGEWDSLSIFFVATGAFIIFLSFISFAISFATEQWEFAWFLWFGLITGAIEIFFGLRIKSANANTLETIKNKIKAKRQELNSIT